MALCCADPCCWTQRNFPPWLVRSFCVDFVQLRTQISYNIKTFLFQFQCINFISPSIYCTIHRHYIFVSCFPLLLSNFFNVRKYFFPVYAFSELFQCSTLILRPFFIRETLKKTPHNTSACITLTTIWNSQMRKEYTDGESWMKGIRG